MGYGVENQRPVNAPYLLGVFTRKKLQSPMKVDLPVLLLGFVFAVSASGLAHPGIDRRALVTKFNPKRNASATTAVTPLQIGNGNFAFGADFTGLQTFLPFATMSSWGWKNDTLPAGKTLEDIENYHGTSWLNHGRPVQYDFGGNDSVIEQWLISNPNRLNLGRVGLVFWSDAGDVANITAQNLTNIQQELDLWTGKLVSNFSLNGITVSVETVSAQDSSAIAITLTSTLLERGRLGLFLDFPWNDGKSKFSAPFVGVWNATSNHTTELDTTYKNHIQARIKHTQVAAITYTSVRGDAFNISRDSPSQHRYTIRASRKKSSFSITVDYRPEVDGQPLLPPKKVAESSKSAWEAFWTKSGFVDVLTGSTDSRAEELQRRIISSRYLMRVNEAGDSPPQESGLVNNGWYGKFHMEMYFWHSAQWALWGNWDLLRRSSSIYSRFLPGSLRRAQVQQGWSSGARWPKMTDPSGRSAPGQINNLLIWQQPHPLIFAIYEYRAFPTHETLQTWKDVVRETANWMAAFAWHNTTAGVYDLGPPLYVVSEDTSPNITQNPVFELAYWRLGLNISQQWMEHLGEEVPKAWIAVKDNLAKLPIDNGTYAVYEGIPSDFWTDSEFTSDHPALVGLHGLLPPTEGLDLDIARATAEKVWDHWNIDQCWGWDFPMLAMSAARNGNTEKAIEWLLHPLFQFDDAGMPIGGTRVPTPYFPGSGALLYAIAMMAGGWDGSTGKAPGFPKEGWNVRVEGLSKAL